MTSLKDEQKVTFDVEAGRDGRESATNIALAYATGRSFGAPIFPKGTGRCSRLPCCVLQPPICPMLNPPKVKRFTFHPRNDKEHRDKPTASWP